MSWAPNDLVTDADLRDYEEAVLTSFGQPSWQAKRTKALEDWLLPILRANGFDPQRLRTRYEADQVWGQTSSVYTDKTASAASATTEDLALSVILATNSDALYVGSLQPFRGLTVQIQDTPSTTSAVLTVSYWNGIWQALTIADGTMKVAGKTCSGGGAVTWLLPMDWQPRPVNASVNRYWVKLVASTAPAPAVAGQVGVIRASALRAPAALRTLQLIMAEAPTGAEGPWDLKRAFYETEANAALQRALALIGGEFDTDGSDLIGAVEAAETAETLSGGGWSFERA